MKCVHPLQKDSVRMKTWMSKKKKKLPEFDWSPQNVAPNTTLFPSEKILQYNTEVSGSPPTPERIRYDDMIQWWYDMIWWWWWYDMPMIWATVQQEGMLLCIRRSTVLTRTVMHRGKQEYQAVMPASWRVSWRLRTGENQKLSRHLFATPLFTLFAQ